MEGHEPTKRAVRVPRTGVFYTYLVCVLVAEIAALIARSQGVHVPQPVFFWPLYMLGPVLAWTAVPRQRREGRVRVDAAGVTLNGETLAKREELTMGLVRRESETTWLRLSGKNRWMSKMLDVAVDDGVEAEKILGFLGLDAKSRTSTFQVFLQGHRRFVLALVGLGAAFGAALVAMLGMARGGASPAFFLGALAVLCVAITGGLIAAVRSQRATITVGVDGLSIDEGFKKPRFLGHDRIREAKANGTMVELVLDDGTTVRYQCGQRTQNKKRTQEAQHVAESIVEKIRAARAAFDELSGDAGNVPALARARRTTKEWVEALRRVAESEGAGYREGTVPRERLLRVAESAHAPEASRLAAAIALSRSASAEEKDRLRALATASASPEMQKRFRIAIDSADETAVLEKMLEEAAAEEEGAPVRSDRRATPEGSTRER